MINYNIQLKRIIKVSSILVILALNISCDQVSKNIVRNNIEYNEHIVVMKNFLTLTKVENTGAFLSFGDSFPRPLNLIFLIILPVAILGSAFIYILIKRDLSNLMILGICLVVGGGFGNVYDRIFIGSVTDFLHMNFIVFQTGIFNIADLSVMAGMIIVLFESYINRKKVKLLTL